ncbi:MULTISPECIES: universal stress protein [Clostridium]|uniref:Universal stress protein n=5 Tax=Clostridium TaxID=1485 RepID=A5I5P2_CLOBH|nr:MULTISPECIES: universal stress protein [Clostridium]EKN38183.1 universal stress protein family protein [Clostridium botulinum CFSAN001627]EKX80524.1 universal stress protein family protein [Clostridium botulinum CFSAN001628]ABS33429.1 universal stress protein family protein [Clostridium botulinum A str. ATCC 19397]ABS39027.1 universal stress protein family protein [Clostridium botulinum A str. Hall]ACA45352.1 universal stress protein family protein [Clostridium botulinum B1 str. Okra]
MEKLKVLVPVDSSERSNYSLNLLENMFDKNQVEVTLINVKEVQVNNIFLIQQQIKKLKDKSEKIMKEAKQKIKNLGYEYEMYSCFGMPADKIVEKAEKDNFDMIVMAKSNKKGLEKIKGSVTTKVVKTSEVPVIVV